MKRINPNIESTLEKLLLSDQECFVDLTRIAGLDPAVDFNGVDLANLDLSDEDLSEFNFIDCDLSGTNLQRSTLTTGSLAGCIIDEHTNLSDIKWKDAKEIDLVEHRPTYLDQQGSASNLANQSTLKNSINLTGVGLHSGEKVGMTIHPAPPDTGIVFHRADQLGLGGDAVIPARWDNVVNTTLSVGIGNAEGSRVESVEHLMAAFAGSEIDNAVVELNGPEVPIMDGSAAPFIFLFECAGKQRQTAPRKAIRILKEVRSGDSERSVALLPYEGFRVKVEIDVDDLDRPHNIGDFDLSDRSFKREISRARTYGFERDIQRLWDLGLVRGGSLDNAVIVAEDFTIMNEGGLRWDDEFVRHKVLDVVGELYLLGAPIIGRYEGVRPSPTLNQALIANLMSDTTSWEWTTIPMSPNDDSTTRNYKSVAG